MVSVPRAAGSEERNVIDYYLTALLLSLSPEGASERLFGHII